LLSIVTVGPKPTLIKIPSSGVLGVLITHSPNKEFVFLSGAMTVPTNLDVVLDQIVEFYTLVENVIRLTASEKLASRREQVRPCPVYAVVGYGEVEGALVAVVDLRVWFNQVKKGCVKAGTIVRVVNCVAMPPSMRLLGA